MKTPPATFRLVRVSGDVTPAAATLEEDTAVVIGREEGCGLRVGSSRASRQHAKVERTGDTLTLEDLGSSTGTRVNGAMIEAPTTLAPGDTVEVGNVIFRLEAPGGAAPGRDDDGLLEALTELLADDAAPAAARLERMLVRLVGAFGADRGRIFVPDEEGTLGELCAADAPRSAVAPGEGISRGLLAEVAAGEEARLLTSVETEELREQFESLPGTLRSILAAPFPMGERRGTLYLDSAIDRHRFADRDARVLLAFARSAGLALTSDEARRKERGRSRRMVEIQARALDADAILGSSARMKAVLEDLEQAAATDVTVLVTGESGTGKELIARGLHRSGTRRDQGFVAVNCAAIPSELVESELFGHEKGAFTGADQRRLGHFELAHGGTLFLDEVGELPATVQGKLLRALQERRIRRVGGTKDLPVDFRLVCATNVDLEAAVKAGEFREDLYYRIAVFRLALPPLRDRGDDVLLLAEAFLERFSREMRKPLEGIEDPAREALRAHPWPGNIRELRNVIEQAVVRERGAGLSLPSIRPALGGTLAGGDGAGGSLPELEAPTLEEARKGFERRYLELRLAEHKGNMRATAEGIGVSRRALYDKCTELGIDYKRYR